MLFERRQFEPDCVPDNFVVDVVVGVPQDVTHTSDALPIRARTKDVSIIAEATRGFCDDLQLPFHCGFGLEVATVSLKAHFVQERVDEANAVKDVAEVRPGVL